MHQNRVMRQVQGEPVVQYHGKWPFVRVLGMQELFSVLFSVGNAVPHLLFLSWLYRFEAKSSKRRTLSLTASDHGQSVSLRFRWHWAAFAVCGCNAWLWSTVFHARDTDVTEKLDYFSALLLIVSGLWVAVVRTFDVRSLRAQLLAALAIGAFYCYHVGYLWLVHFDYGYNMAVNVAAGLLSSALWLRWLYAQRARPYAKKFVLAIVVVYPLVALELLDFAPLGLLVDAHALWHGATIPCGFLFYSAVKDDLFYCATEMRDDQQQQQDDDDRRKLR
jgi:post-GPI attachment to proteins factor 3